MIAIAEQRREAHVARSIAVRSVAALIAVCACWVAAAPSAQACSTAAPPPAFDGYPAEGAEEVPTDVVPYYSTPVFVEDVTALAFTLTAADGTSIAITARSAGVWTFELVPETALEPDTDYVLHVGWKTTVAPEPVPQDLHFTTGAGPLTKAPAMPIAKLAHYHLSDLDAQRSSSDPSPYGTCIAVEGDDAIIESRFVDAIGQPDQYGWYSATGAAFGGNLTGIDQGTPFTCVELRTRAVNGTFSDVVTLCGSDFPLQEFAGNQIECTSAGLKGKPLPKDMPAPEPSPEPEPSPSEPEPPALDRSTSPTNGMGAAGTAGTSTAEPMPMQPAQQAAPPSAESDAGGCSASATSRATGLWPIAGLASLLLLSTRRRKRAR